MTTAHQLKCTLKKSVQNAMEKWFRDLFYACDKKRVEKIRELVSLEENNRRAKLWIWDAACFDKAFITEKDDLLHRAVLLSEAKKMV